jgi:hypothetical protein
MTFEYRDHDGDVFSVEPIEYTDGRRVVSFETEDGPCHVPLDRMEEVVAGIRDAARQAAGQPTTEAECGSRSLPTYSGEVVRCVLGAGHTGQCQSATEYPYVSWPNPSNGVWNLAAACHPAEFEGECPCTTGCGCCKAAPAPPAEDRVTVYGIGINEWDDMQLALRRIEAAVAGPPAVGGQDATQPATEAGEARGRIENLWDRAIPVAPLLDAYRAEILREATEKIRQEVSDQWDRGNQDWDVHDAADLLRRMADEASTP